MTRDADHDTFSDELQGAPDAVLREHDSFSDELRGATDSIIEEADHPKRRMGRGVVPLVIVFGLVIGIAVGGAYALWSHPESLTRFFGGEPPEATDSSTSTSGSPRAEGRGATPTEQELPAVDNPFDDDFEEDEATAVATAGITDIEGDPDAGSGPARDGAAPEAPSAPTDDVSGSVAASGGRVALASEDISVGAGAGGGTKARLQGQLDEIQDCFDAATARGKAPTGSFEASFSIKWNGNAYGVTATGGDRDFQACVRKAIGGSYPHPRSSVTKDPKIRATFRVSP